MTHSTFDFLNVFIYSIYPMSINTFGYIIEILTDILFSLKPGTVFFV